MHLKYLEHSMHWDTSIIPLKNVYQVNIIPGEYFIYNNCYLLSITLVQVLTLSQVLTTICILKVGIFVPI